MKLIDLKRVVAHAHKVAMLVYHASLAQPHEMRRLVERYLFLKLIARHAAVTALALDGQVGLVVTHAHAHRGAFGRDIALLDVACRRSLALKGATMLNQELTFYFQSTHYIIILLMPG